MVAGGLPTPQVLLDDGTGSFPYDITTWCRLPEGLTGGRGRGDELAQTAAQQITLVLDNTNGEFTMGSTLIASPSPIKLDAQIRVKLTANATTVNRYTAALSAAPSSWPSGGDEFTLVKATLIDPQARAERYPLLSAAETLITAAGPSAYYPMDEPSTSTTCADRSGNQNPMMSAYGVGVAPTFGDHLGNTALGAPKFAAGKGLAVTGLASTTDFTFIVAFSSTSTANSLAIATTPNGRNILLNLLGVGNVGQITAWSTGTTMNDGQVHVIAIVSSAGTTSVYVDGVFVTSFADATPPASPANIYLGVQPDNTNPFIGDIGQTAYWTSVLTPTQVADISTAIMVGYPAERTDQRASRIATIAGLALGTLDVGATTMTAGDPGATSASAAIQSVAETEFGIAYFNGSGALDFHNRNRGPLKATPDITVDANFLDEGTEVEWDMQGVVNYLEVTAAGTSVTQVARNTTSEITNKHGRYPGNATTYLVQTDAEALDRGNWIVNTKGEPLPRAGSLVVDLMTMTAAQQAAWLLCEPDHWIRITGLPATTHGGTTLDVVVEGWTEAMNASAWTLTLNVVARSFFTAWILGDTTFSVLGSTTKLYI